MNQRNAFRALLDDLRPRSRATRDERQRQLRNELDARAAAVLIQAKDQTLRAVLDLHRPVVETLGVWPVCRGCDSFDGPDAEPADWPCRTWMLIQQRLTR
jgi:hypothetical protein